MYSTHTCVVIEGCIRNAFIITIIRFLHSPNRQAGMYKVGNFSINVHATVGLSFSLHIYAVMLSCALMV